MLKTIDIFGEPVKILVNNKSTIKTSLGGIFSILTLFLILIFTWFTGRDILFKEKPFSYTQKQVVKKFPPLDITKDNFP